MVADISEVDISQPWQINPICLCGSLCDPALYIVRTWYERGHGTVICFLTACSAIDSDTGPQGKCRPRLPRLIKKSLRSRLLDAFVRNAAYKERAFRCCHSDWLAASAPLQQSIQEKSI